jgi:hypothetical protein
MPARCESFGVLVTTFLLSYFSLLGGWVVITRGSILRKSVIVHQLNPLIGASRPWVLAPPHGANPTHQPYSDCSPSQLRRGRLPLQPRPFPLRGTSTGCQLARSRHLPTSRPRLSVGFVSGHAAALLPDFGLERPSLLGSRTTFPSVGRLLVARLAKSESMGSGSRGRKSSSEVRSAASCWAILMLFGRLCTCRRAEDQVYQGPAEEAKEEEQQPLYSDDVSPQLERAAEVA